MAVAPRTSSRTPCPGCTRSGAGVSAADAPLAYVRRSLVNRFLNLKRRPSEREVVMADVPDLATPGDLADRVSERGALSQLMCTLPQRQQAALVLRYFHDLADDDIAAALGCRTGTVRSLLSRGLDTLRSLAADPSYSANGTG